MNIYEKLTALQSELKAPKGQYNTFGKYKYRNCEDILEALKPLLVKHGLALYISDDIVQLGDRFYVKATATVININEDGQKIEVTAFAREEESKKGMDGSQVTGASSSYARKYALNGLFAIDDTKDSDTTNNGTNGGETPINKPPVDYRKEYINLCKEKGIDSIKYAQEHGINKQTTQEQYKAICETLRSGVVSMNDL